MWASLENIGAHVFFFLNKKSFKKKNLYTTLWCVDFL